MIKRLFLFGLVCELTTFENSEKGFTNFFTTFWFTQILPFISLLYEQSTSRNTCNLETFGSIMSTMLKKKKKTQTQHKTCFCFAECADRRI